MSTGVGETKHAVFRASLSHPLPCLPAAAGEKSPLSFFLRRPTPPDAPHVSQTTISRHVRRPHDGTRHDTEQLGLFGFRPHWQEGARHAAAVDRRLV
jgi:hypothetical protein